MGSLLFFPPSQEPARFLPRSLANHNHIAWFGSGRGFASAEQRTTASFRLPPKVPESSGVCCMPVSRSGRLGLGALRHFCGQSAGGGGRWRRDGPRISRVRKRLRRALKLQRGLVRRRRRLVGRALSAGVLESILRLCKVRVPSRYLNENTSMAPGGKAEHPDLVRRDLWRRFCRF